MTVHIERCHHRTHARRAAHGRRRWFAGCQHCGFFHWLETQHEAFIVALAHADGNLR